LANLSLTPLMYRRIWYNILQYIGGVDKKYPERLEWISGESM